MSQLGPRHHVPALVMVCASLMSCTSGSDVDITVFLKEMNQQIAPLAVFCPDWHYPSGAAVECTLEFQGRYVEALVVISPGGIELADPQLIDRMMVTYGLKNDDVAREVG